MYALMTSIGGYLGLFIGLSLGDVCIYIVDPVVKFFISSSKHLSSSVDLAAGTNKKERPAGPQEMMKVMMKEEKDAAHLLTNLVYRRHLLSLHHHNNSYLWARDST